VRLAVGNLVVDGDPAVSRRRDDGRSRPKDARDELRDRLDDGRLIVRLQVDGAEGGRCLAGVDFFRSRGCHSSQESQCDALARLLQLEHDAALGRRAGRADDRAVLLRGERIALAPDVHAGSREPVSR
jgi:hypothetical protein